MNDPLLNELPFTAELAQYTTPSGHILQTSQHARDLGINMSADYTWSYHIGEMINNARKAASWVLGVFKTRSLTVMILLFKSLVRSRVEYCCPLWNPLKIADIQKIEDIQRQFTRRIHGFQDIDYWERLTALKLLSLQRRRERYLIIHVWKILNEHAPNDLNMEFSHDNKRLGIRVKIPAFNKSAPMSAQTLFDSSFAVHAGKLWNTLPESCSTVKQLDSFKIHLSNFLRQYPDKPPIKGYTYQNGNSIIDWKQSGGLQVAQRPC